MRRARTGAAVEREKLRRLWPSLGHGYGEKAAFSGLFLGRWARIGCRFTWNYALACFDRAEQQKYRPRAHDPVRCQHRRGG